MSSFSFPSLATLCSAVLLLGGCALMQEEPPAAEPSLASETVDVCLVMDPEIEHSSLSMTLHRLLEQKGLRVLPPERATSNCRIEVRFKGRWNESFTGLVDGELSYRDLVTGESRVVSQRTARGADLQNAFLARNAVAPEDTLKELVDGLIPDRFSPQFVNLRK